MRELPHAGLLELQETEAGAVLAFLRTLGYLWLQEDAGKNHNLYDRSGDMCVGEMWAGRLYLDVCVKPDLEKLVSGTIISGYQTEFNSGFA